MGYTLPMRRICSLGLGFFTLVCIANEIPDVVIPSGVGVNIHFVRGHEQDLDLIQAAGFRFIRMDFGWAGIERVKGEYRWAEYEELLSNLDQRGIRAVFILDYSNPLYEPEVTSTNPLTHELHHTIASPQHPESVAAYATWAAAAARHFHGRHILWELWNEPNIDFWSPKPDVAQYITMALAAAEAIRRADPGATIIGPASSGFPWSFLEAFLKSGILKHLDAVSVHPYRNPQKPPETAAADYARLKQLIDQCAAAARKGPVPILSGEWGYSSWQRGVSIETQAAFAVRQQLVNLAHGVPLSIWYDWKNDGTDPSENEHNFGTVTSDLKPKPAYIALQTLTRQLADYRYVRRVPLENTNDFVLLFSNSAGKEKLAAWTVAQAHPVRVGLTGDTSDTAVVLGNGEGAKLNLEASGCILDLGMSPSFVTLGKAAAK
jgi:polysaccharide biosynthesis protein PslG